METTVQKKVPTSLGGSFGNGWDVMSKNFLVLLLVVIVVAIASFPAQFVGMGFDANNMHFDDWGNFEFFDSAVMALGMFAVIAGIISLAYSLLVVPVFSFGSKMMFVQAVRAEKPEFETLIVGFRKNYLHIVLANVLVGALVVMGFIFLIVPGIIVACRLTFVPYLVIDKGLDPIAAVEESWKMTKGHGWTVFGMAVLSFFIAILGLILCFIGILPAIMWISSSFASLYEGIQAERNIESQSEPSGALDADLVKE